MVLFLRILHGHGEPVIVVVLLFLALVVARVSLVVGAGGVPLVGLARFFIFPAKFGLGLHGEGDAITFEVDFGDRYMDFLADFDDFGWVTHEFVSELTNVNESVLVDTDIDEGPEGGNISDDAGELHSDDEIGGFFHSFSKGEDLELLARVTSRFGQLSHDVFESGETNFFTDVLLKFDVFASSGIS